MDLNEFWQENKRWVLGVVFGFLLFFVAKAILGSVYSTSPQQMEARRLLQGSSEPLYDAAARTAAQQDDRALRTELDRLRRALEFHPDPRYQLEGKGMAADAYLTQQGRELKKRLIGRANALDTTLLDKDIVYPTPVGVDEIRRTLLGLDVVNQAVSRLLSAHERVRQADPDAVGLRAIQQFKVEDRPAARRPGLRPLRRGGKDAVDLSGLVTESRVAFQFQADSPTAILFLEALKDPDNPLALEDFAMTQGNRRGDPLTVKGKLLALVFRQPAESQEGPQ